MIINKTKVTTEKTTIERTVTYDDFLKLLDLEEDEIVLELTHEYKEIEFPITVFSCITKESQC